MGLRRRTLPIGLAAITLLAALLPAASAGAAERTVAFTVAKMTCFLCPLTVKKAMRAVPGVTSVRVDRKAGRAVVTFDDAVATPARIARAATEAGYPAVPLKGTVP